jgi:hypothetical protein
MNASSGFFKDVSDGFTKGALQSDRITDPDLKIKKTAKTLARFLNRNRTKREQHTVQ